VVQLKIGHMVHKVSFIFVGALDMGQELFAFRLLVNNDGRADRDIRKCLSLNYSAAYPLVAIKAKTLPYLHVL